MLRVLTDMLRSGFAPKVGWQRTLSERGLDPLVHRTLCGTTHLGDAWPRCPRVDWALEVAVVARVEPGLIAQGLGETLEEIAEWAAAAPDLEVLERAHAELAHGRIDATTLLTRCRPHLLSAVDAAPDVRAALLELRRAEQWRNRARIQAKADEYDHVHVRAHGLLAERFRRQVTAEALRFALEGTSAHPYR